MSWPWQTHPRGGSALRGGGGRGPAGSRPQCTIACCTLAHRTLAGRILARCTVGCICWQSSLLPCLILPTLTAEDSKKRCPANVYPPTQQKDRRTDTSTRFSKHGAIWLARDQDTGRHPRPPLRGHPATSPQFWQGYARTRKCFMIVKTVVWKTLVFQSSVQLGSPCAAQFPHKKAGSFAGPISATTFHPPASR